MPPSNEYSKVAVGFTDAFTVTSAVVPTQLATETPDTVGIPVTVTACVNVEEQLDELVITTVAVCAPPCVNVIFVVAAVGVEAEPPLEADHA